jgi:hypothetical protein
MNASWPGTHTLRHTQYLQQMSKYNPDLVVLLYVFNDLEYLSDDEPLALANRQPARTVLANSYLANLAHERLRLAWYGIKGYRGPAFGYGELLANPYRQPEILRRHLEDVRAFVEMGRRHGSAVEVVPFDPDVKLSGVAAERYQHFIQGAREFGIPIVDPADALKRHRYDQLILNPLDRHPSAFANRVVAEFVAARLD